MVMKFNDFVHEYKLEKKATSIIKFHKVVASIGLDKVDIYLKDGLFLGDLGIVNLPSSKGTHWVAYMNKNYFDT